MSTTLPPKTELSSKMKMQIALNKQKAQSIKAQKKIALLEEEVKKLKKELFLERVQNDTEKLRNMKQEEESEEEEEEEYSHDGYQSPDYEAAFNTRQSCIEYGIGLHSSLCWS